MSALSIRQAEFVTQILSHVLSQFTSLDRAYSQHFANQALSSSDKSLISQCCGDIIRRLNLFCYLADVPQDEASEQPEKLLTVWHYLQQLDAPMLLKQAMLNRAEFDERLAQAKQQSQLWQGCPDWLESLGQSQLGAAWPKEREAMAQRPGRFIRVNTLKTTSHELQASLQQAGIASETVADAPEALSILSEGALFQTEAYQSGWFEQQDAGSQLVAAALDVKPGMKVFDACAGNGGKTLALAAAMQGRGRLLAMDVEEWKLKNLKQRAKRAGAHNVETRLIESSKTIKRRKMTADRLLLDVPCSGLGVLKRKPLAKWHDTAERLGHLTQLQQDILQRYSQLLKVEGILVYATCSILPIENELQVKQFLQNNPNFTLLEQQTISPSETGFDGFYWAKIQRQQA
ncbi:RsmB/NOP family class I SAM-dependent RNA methyltransferase [Motilimonas pumila]|uniref:RsmB/NOP family class I SAM-dependent RNA methyltransferase n=1 Tax=Motilimonas pumila TaxID=2303987 RepID=A0A418YHN9_9GAMM|nr:RsmB/NOP family class I SAM-dependent RNA methyltransferase [Motilimonas pumila]RJG49882.1 RsmB/NOP family class I SAM-dependent RNA methyltransferase [Motilimonas pumila]